MDRLGATVGIVLLHGGCWWEARPGSVPVIEAARVPSVSVAAGNENRLAMHLLIRAGSAHDPVGREGLACRWAQTQEKKVLESLEPELLDRVRVSTDFRELSVGRELIRISIWSSDAGAVEAWPQVASDLSTFLSEIVLQVPGETAPIDLGEGLQAHSRMEARFLDWLYAGHPYGHDPGCDRAPDGRLSPDQVLQFHTDRILRSSVGFVVELPDGSAETSAAMAPIFEQVSERLGELPPELYEDVTPRKVPRPLEGRLLLVEGGGSEVWMGWATEVHPGHPDWAAMLMAREILELRLSPLEPELGPVSGIPWLSSDGQTPDWLGLPVVVGWGHSEAPEAMLRAVVPKLEAWARGSFTDAEIDRARTRLQQRLARGTALRTAGGQLLDWSEGWASLEAELDAMDAEGLTAALGGHILPEYLRVGVGMAPGETPDWIQNEETGDLSVDSTVPPSYDWQMGDPIRIDLQEL